MHTGSGLYWTLNACIYLASPLAKLTAVQQGRGQVLFFILEEYKLVETLSKQFSNIKSYISHCSTWQDKRKSSDTVAVFCCNGCVCVCVCVCVCGQKPSTAG